MASPHSHPHSSPPSTSPLPKALHSDSSRLPRGPPKGWACAPEAAEHTGPVRGLREPCLGHHQTKEVVPGNCRACVSGLGRLSQLPSPSQAQVLSGTKAF